MLVKCIESFKFTHGVDFIKDKEYIFEIKAGYLVYSTKDGKVYEITILTLKKYFTQVVF